jgi:hypothetical protein
MSEVKEAQASVQLVGDHQTTQEKGSNPSQLFSLLLRRWKIAIGVCTAVAAAGAIWAWSLPDTWEAKVLIRIAQSMQIGQLVGPSGQLGPSLRDVESPALATERLKQEGFRDQVIVSLGLDRNDTSALLYRSTLKAKHIQVAGVIEVRTRGYSSNEAKHFIAATIAQLGKEHNKMIEVDVSRLRSTHAGLTEKEKDLHAKLAAERKALTTLATHGGTPIAPSMVTLYAALVGDLSRELKSVEQQRLFYEEALGVAYAYPTVAVEPAYVGERPVGPHRTLIIIFAVLMGALAATTTVWIVERLRVHR